MSTIIVKSLGIFMGNRFPEYTKYTIEGKKVFENELDPIEGRKLVRELPEIYRIDSDNIIYGDSDFKDKCPKAFKEKINKMVQDGI